MEIKGKGLVILYLSCLLVCVQFFDIGQESTKLLIGQTAPA